MLSVKPSAAVLTDSWPAPKRGAAAKSSVVLVSERLFASVGTVAEYVFDVVSGLKHFLPILLIFLALGVLLQSCGGAENPSAPDRLAEAPTTSTGIIGPARAEGETPQSKRVYSLSLRDDGVPAFWPMPPGEGLDMTIVISSSHQSPNLPQITAAAIDRLRSSSLDRTAKPVEISAQLSDDEGGRLNLGMRPMFSVRRYAIDHARPPAINGQDDSVLAGPAVTTAKVRQSPEDPASPEFWVEIALPIDSRNARRATDRIVGNLNWVFAPQNAIRHREGPEVQERDRALRAGPYLTQSAAAAVCVFVRSRGEACHVVSM